MPPPTTLPFSVARLNIMFFISLISFAPGRLESTFIVLVFNGKGLFSTVSLITRIRYPENQR